VAIWQHVKRVLGIFSLHMRSNGYLGASGARLTKNRKCYLWDSYDKWNLWQTYDNGRGVFRKSYITHSHGRRRSKSMEKAKIRPLATPKPLNRSSPKLTGVITSWTAAGMQNFVAIGAGVSVPQIRDFAVLLGWLVFCSFFWVLQ